MYISKINKLLNLNDEVYKQPEQPTFEDIYNVFDVMTRI